jgi:serine/threonine-protein kinase
VPVSPDAVDAKIPAALSSIVMKCLAKPANDRYDRGFELADALIGFLAGSGSSADLRGARMARQTGLTPL